MHLAQEIDVIDLSHAEINLREGKLQFTLKCSNPRRKKYRLKCLNESDYKGWKLMITNKQSGPQVDAKVAKQKSTFGLHYSLGLSHHFSSAGDADDTHNQSVDQTLCSIENHLSTLQTIARQQGSSIHRQHNQLSSLQQSVSMNAEKLKKSSTKLKKGV